MLKLNQIFFPSLPLGQSLLELSILVILILFLGPLWLSPILSGILVF